MPILVILAWLCCFMVQPKSSTGLQQQLFARMLSPYDTAFQYVFSPLSSTTVRNSFECSSWALQTSTLSVKSKRASGFIFNKTTSACTIGQTLVYNDYFINNGIEPEGDTEVYILAGKPLASIMNSDTWFYTLLNEERSAYFSHPNFIMAWPTGSPPNWSPFTYTYFSPVMSYGGMYGTTFPANTTLTFMAKPYSNPPGLTFLVWFRASSPSDYPMVSICPSSGYLFELWQVFSWTQSCFNYIPGPGQDLKAKSDTNATSIGQWTYVGVTYDAATSKYAFYRNGSNFGSGPMTMSSFGSLIDHIYIGTNCGKNNYLTGGAIASVEIYLRALNASEVVQAMAKSYTGRTVTGVLSP